ncbi:ABCG25, partial [Symbiodinium sp. CCMP2592]
MDKQTRQEELDMARERRCSMEDQKIQDAMLAEIAKMQGPEGFDYVVICCSDQSAEDFWQARLTQTIRQVTGSSSTVICVHEETRYDQLCSIKHAGKSVAIYHTAGKGTRLAPLPGAENNNKPGVKLPGLLSVAGRFEPITVLESVLRQTSSYGAVRGGFLGRPDLRAFLWYGLIAVDSKGDAMQLEKVTYDVAVQYLPKDVAQVGTSLGSFSVSAALMDALLAEFASELNDKKACLDSDPHFWMPLTLKKADYIAVMGKKGTTAAEAGKHYDRMAEFKSSFKKTGGILGCVDVGQQAYWWDYGRLELYMRNNFLITEANASAHALRTFLRLQQPSLESDLSLRQQWNTLDGVTVDPTSVVLNCRIGAGKIGPGCVLVNVVAPTIDVENCILVKVSSSRPISGKAGLLYNVVEDGKGDTLPCDRVRADVFMPDGIHHKIYSTPSTDGGKVWKEKVQGNNFSFEGIYKANQPLDVSKCTEAANSSHDAVGNKVMPVSALSNIFMSMYSCCAMRSRFVQQLSTCFRQSRSDEQCCKLGAEADLERSKRRDLKAINRVDALKMEARDELESFIQNPYPVPLKQVLAGRLRPVPTVSELLAAYKDQREELEFLEKEDIPMRAQLCNQSIFQYVRDIQLKAEAERMRPPEPVAGDLLRTVGKKKQAPTSPVNRRTKRVLEQRRQQRRVALPFLTRWRWQRGEVGLFQSELPEVEAGQMPAPRERERPAAAEVRESASASGASPSSGGTSPTNPGQRSSSSMPVSTLPGVSFRLEDVGFELPDGKKLLKEIDFTIDAGRRVAVMGPSGSGKTTLLGVLSGRASYGRVSGKLTVGGRPADDLRFLQNVTGFVPQDDVLHGELTVAENLRFQASLRLPAGRPREEVDACVTAVAKDLNLSSLLNARVGTPERRGVSGGQRKRVSIGMELVAQPLLLFADEPTSGLDSTTSHEVVRCLNGAAARLNSTVVAVIHQPRYETLRLFDDLVLLAYGGCLVYAGPTEDAVEHFKTRLHVTFSNNTNPADILLDAIQPPINDPEVCASAWKSCAALQDKVEQVVLPASIFRRTRQPFFRAVLIYMDRSMLQTIRAYVSLAINYSLCCVAVLLLCMILTYNRLDQFLMQSALAALFLMLLQGVAAQQVFGADLLTTWREARVGMPMVAYFVAKDLTACIEVTLSSAVFAAAYGYASGSQVSLRQLFAGSWAFVFAIFGLNYIFSIILSPGAAQMSAVVTSFLSFCTAGVYQPQLNEMASMFEGRGWMVPALSPVRWLWGYLLTAEVPNLTPLTLEGSAGTLRGKGYDVEYLHDCKNSMVGIQDQAVRTLQEAWLDNRGWVCSTAPLLLLGILFRFLAGCCLLLYVSAQTSGWARFFGQSELGAWKLAGHFFKLLVGSFLIIFLFAEVWIFGSLHLDFK